MRRKRDPGTRNPLSCPLSKQRMMVCWLTLQILAASPVVKTVFMGSPPLKIGGANLYLWVHQPVCENRPREPLSSMTPASCETRQQRLPDSLRSVICLGPPTIGEFCLWEG